MPKGIYSRDGALGGQVWTDEQDEWLRARCQTSMPYRVIAMEFAAAFPDVHPKRTRCAMMGRAARRGYNIEKPPAHNDTRVRKPKAQPITPRQPRVKVNDALGSLLRADSTPLGSIPSPDKRPRGAQQIEEARKGHIPQIIETAPTSSVPLSDAPRGSCKWPTNDDPSDFHVCGQPGVIGSYCERHAQVAYRTMPTVRRNKITRAQVKVA